MPASIKIPATFTAVDKFSDVVSKMGKNVKNFSKKGVSAVERFDNRMTSSFKKIGRLGQLALGLSIGTIFMSAVQNNIAYEDSLASVSAITGAVGEDLVKLEKLSMKTAKAKKMLGKDVLKAYELIGSAKPELLTNAKLLDNVTNSAVTLSRAGRMELEPAAEALTTTLNQFNLGGEHAEKVIDNLAAGAKYGSSSITNTSEALSKFGTIAAATGTKVDESIALIELVSPFEKGAEAGTKLRNVLGKMAGAKILPAAALKTLEKAGVNIDIVSDKTLPLSTRLKEMSKVGADASDVMQVFGTENAALAQAVFDNVDNFDGMLEKINESGVAMNQSSTNTNTFRFAIDSIKTSFLNVTTATQSNNIVLEYLKNLLSLVASNMDIVLAVVGGLIAAYILMKAIIIGNTIAIAAYNIALGVSTAITQNNKRALVGNVVAQTSYKIAMAAGTAITWLATAATTAFGVALNLGLWPILAIIAAIVAVILIIKNWSSITKWFGEKWTQFTNWIGEAWQSVVDWFTEFDFKQMFIDIGQSILKFMLAPMKAMLKLLSNVPGKIGALAKMGLDKIDDITGEIDVKNKSEVLPSTSQASANSVQKSINESNLRIDIKDKGGNVEKVSRGGDEIPVSIGPTLGVL
jgi:TP901 family phage tail tape measure protein